MYKIQFTLHYVSELHKTILYDQNNIPMNERKVEASNLNFKDITMNIHIYFKSLKFKDLK